MSMMMTTTTTTNKAKLYSPFTPTGSVGHAVDFIPSSTDRPAGLDVDDFLPVSFVFPSIPPSS